MKTFKLNLMLVAAVCSAALVPAAFGQTREKPKILNPEGTHYGMTYGEWSAAWWVWAFSLPVPDSPFFDDGVCTNGANGQSGPVWFLCGVFNESGTTTRECTVPAGKALFFPIINVECSDVECLPWLCCTWCGMTEPEQRACAVAQNEPASDLECEIDDVVVRNFARYRVESPQFSVTLPENNLFGVEEGAVLTGVADGYYVMVAPLPPGQHTIRFRGCYPGFCLDVTYHLTVE